MRIEDGVHMRRARKDCTVDTFEKTRGLPKGSLRHKESNRKMRKDKTIDSIRKQYGEDSI